MALRPAPPAPLPRLRRRDIVRLADGRDLWLRPVHPLDAGPIAGAFALLDDDEIRRRYQHPVKELSPEYLAFLVAPPPDRACVLVAAEPLPPGEALVGAVARATVDDDGGDGAEFALLVARLISGQGVGTALMRRLCAWARRKGIRRLHGEILDDNAPMIALVQKLGFEREPGAHTAGRLQVSLRLPAGTRRRR